MKTTMKKITYTVIIIVGVLVLTGCSDFLTGCGNFLKYYIRQAPDEAMEEYLEEKYDDDVTCLDWYTGDGSFIWFWNQSGSNGKFSSKKYPGVEIGCGAALKEGGWSYSFHDDYQQEVYKSGVQEIMEKMATEYFEGEYYVVVKGAGKLDDDTVKAMPFEEYIKRYLRYSVTIYVRDMDDDEAIGAMQAFVADAQSQGFQCNFYLGKANTNIVSKEDYYSELAEKGDLFDYSYGNGMESFTEWLYRYSLSYKEGKEKPKIIILGEEIR